MDTEPSGNDEGRSGLCVGAVRRGERYPQISTKGVYNSDFARREISLY